MRQMRRVASQSKRQLIPAEAPPHIMHTSCTHHPPMGHSEGAHFSWKTRVQVPVILQWYCSDLETVGMIHEACMKFQSIVAQMTAEPGPRWHPGDFSGQL